MIELLNNHDTWMCNAFAADVLEEIGGKKAIEPLADALEDPDNFLNNLLDDYITEMPEETFDPTKRDWKYRNVDFFISCTAW